MNPDTHTEVMRRRKTGAIRNEPIILTDPKLTLALLVASDALSVVLSIFVSVAVAGLLGYDLRIRAAQILIPVVAISLLAYWGARLYPAVALAPAEELHRCAVVTTRVYFAVIILMAIPALHQSAWALLLPWALTIVSVPLMRSVLRSRCVHMAWWGHSAFVFVQCPRGRNLVLSLQKNPAFGIKPVAIFDENQETRGVLHGVPAFGGFSVASKLRDEYDVKYAILALPSYGPQQLRSLIEEELRSFEHLIVVPNPFGVSSLAARDVAGVLGIEVQQRLLSPYKRAIKRGLDLATLIASSVVVIPLVAVIAALIKLASPGPAFYGQKRLGLKGREFTAWKFRSMVTNGDEMLRQHLERNEQPREEWAREQKLKNDPRVSRIGSILRKTSLDELPQLWNVLKGEMSLVGPRPIVRNEVEKYGSYYDLYKKVPSGLTGLWQVSGRSDVSYEERTELDAYYVRNWSVWLDLVILARTVRALVLDRGAY